MTAAGREFQMSTSRLVKKTSFLH